MMIQILYGDEPYKILTRKRNLREKITNLPMNFTSMEGEFTSELAIEARYYPILSDRRLIELDINSLSEIDNKFFIDYLSNPCETTDLIITIKNLNKNTKIYKKLNKLNLIHEMNKVKSKKDLEKVFVYEAKKLNHIWEEDGLDSFIYRLNYDAEDINLMVASRYIIKICSALEQGIAINKEIVEKYVPLHEEANIFSLCNLLVKKDINGLYKQISLLEESDNMRTIGLITKNFRTAIEHYYGGTKQSPFKNIELSILINCMDLCNHVNFGIKNGHLSQKNSLAYLISTLIQMI